MMRNRHRTAGLVALILSCARVAAFAESPLEDAGLPAWPAVARARAEQLAQLLADRPDDPIAMRGRVEALLEADDWTAALREASRYHERLPDAPELAAALAQAQFRGGALRQAEQLVEGLVRMENPPPRALGVLARVREAQGRSSEARTLMQRALAATPEDRNLLYWAADVAVERSESADYTRRYLERSEGDDPDRIEGARGALKMLEALGERIVWRDRARPERLEVPLYRLWDPTTGQTQAYTIQVALGAKPKPVTLMFDTGSPGLFVLQRIARKREFAALGERTVYGGGGDQRHATGRGLFPTFDVAGLGFDQALASTTKQELDPIGRYHGLLGLAVFGGYLVTVDLRKPSVRLEPIPDEPNEPGLRYWSIGGQLLVEAEVRTDAGVVVPGLFLLDTGATRTLLAQSLVERLEGPRLGPPAQILGFGGAYIGARSVEGVHVLFAGLGNRRVEALRVADLSTRSRLAGVEVSGFLGLDFLDGRSITLDTARRTVRVRDPP